MPTFKTPEEFVAFKVFKQTLTRLGVDTYQVVDRFTPTGNPIVGAYETLEEAERVRDELRAKRLKEVR